MKIGLLSPKKLSSALDSGVGIAGGGGFGEEERTAAALRGEEEKGDSTRLQVPHTIFPDHTFSNFEI